MSVAPLFGRRDERREEERETRLFSMQPRHELRQVATLLERPFR